MKTLHSIFSIVGRTAVSVSITAACLVTAVPAAHASASTSEGYLTAGIGAIRQLDEADVDLTKAARSNDIADYEAARKHVSNYYYKFYDPKLEGPSRALSPVDDRPRKPQMEGYKGDAIRAIRLCITKDPRCDNKVNFAYVDRLRVNVARDVLILAGLVDDSAPEPEKMAAAKLFIAAIQKTKKVNDVGAFTKASLKSKLQVETGKVITNIEDKKAVDNDPGRDPDVRQAAHSEKSSSSEFTLPVVIITVVATVVGAAIALGCIPGLTPPR